MAGSDAKLFLILVSRFSFLAAKKSTDRLVFCMWLLGVANGIFSTICAYSRSFNS